MRSIIVMKAGSPKKGQTMKMENFNNITNTGHELEPYALHKYLETRK
jgi:hypothetical protein